MISSFVSIFFVSKLSDHGECFIMGENLNIKNIEVNVETELLLLYEQSFIDFCRARPINLCTALHHYNRIIYYHLIIFFFWNKSNIARSHHLDVEIVSLKL